VAADLHQQLYRLGSRAAVFKLSRLFLSGTSMAQFSDVTVRYSYRWEGLFSGFLASETGSSQLWLALDYFGVIGR